MPVTAQSIRNTPYNVNLAAQVAVAGTLPGPVPQRPPLPPRPPLPLNATKYGNHTIYPTLNARINLNVILPVPGVDARATLSGPPAVGGDTIFLKFFNNEITSVRLPCPAPGGVTLFVTDNLSGCRFFVDRIEGSADLMVYHANTLKHSAGAGANAEAQTDEASTLLKRMHDDAQEDYRRYGVVLNDHLECTKATYYRAAGVAERRKRDQHRGGTQVGGRPDFWGGTTIVGFPAGNTWEFWYQTWGTVDYTRPDVGVGTALFTGHWNYLRKRATQGLSHAATYAKMKVIDCGQII